MNYFWESSAASVLFEKAVDISFLEAVVGLIRATVAYKVSDKAWFIISHIALVLYHKVYPSEAERHDTNFNQ